MVWGAAGEQHSLVVVQCGAVFSFGHGWCGQLGHGDEEDLSVPKRIEALAEQRALAVSAGGGHSIVVAASGHVYTFGLGTCGRLGIIRPTDMPEFKAMLERMRICSH